MGRLSALPVVVALAGCVAPGPKLEAFHPEHQDQARYTRDLYECDYESKKATGGYTPDTRGMRTEFGRALSAQMDMDSRQVEIGMACMRARGYQFRPAGSGLIASAPSAAPPSRSGGFHGQHAGHAIGIARQVQCARDPDVNMTKKVADAETYWAECDNGSKLQIRCDSSTRCSATVR